MVLSLAATMASTAYTVKNITIEGNTFKANTTSSVFNIQGADIS